MATVRSCLPKEACIGYSPENGNLEDFARDVKSRETCAVGYDANVVQNVVSVETPLLRI